MKTENIPCPYCSGTGWDEEILSFCCGAKIPQWPDYDICLECKEHTEPAECEECSGGGEIEPPEYYKALQQNNDTLREVLQLVSKDVEWYEDSPTLKLIKRALKQAK